jgi:hypothetical protein
MPIGEPLELRPDAGTRLDAGDDHQERRRPLAGRHHRLDHRKLDPAAWPVAIGSPASRSVTAGELAAAGTSTVTA